MIHKTLNPKLFEKLIINKRCSYSLKSDVCQKLNEIGETFIAYLKDNGVDATPIDIQLVGSNASYDYNESSDIDLHVILDFDAISCDTNILQIALNSEKRQFNNTYDITVKGIEVEIYVENVNSSAISDGVYSTLRNCWVSYPTYTDVRLPNIGKEVSKIVKLSSKLLKYGNENSINQLINQLYLIRQNGLRKFGKYSKGNLVFKELRDLGILDKLKDKRDTLRSRELTLERLLKRK